MKKIFCPKKCVFQWQLHFWSSLFFFWSLFITTPVVSHIIYYPLSLSRRFDGKPGLPVFWHRSLLAARMALLTTQWWCATSQSQSEWQKAYKLYGWHCTYLTSTHWHVNLVHLAGGVTFPPATVSPMQPPRRLPTDSREEERWTSEGGCMEMARLWGLGHMAAWYFIQTYQVLQIMLYCFVLFVFKKKIQKISKRIQGSKQLRMTMKERFWESNDLVWFVEEPTWTQHIC